MYDSVNYDLVIFHSNLDYVKCLTESVLKDSLLARLESAYWLNEGVNEIGGNFIAVL